MSEYTPQAGDIMADDWVIPADGRPPFSYRRKQVSEELSEHAKGYEAGQEDLYTWAYGIVEDWYAMKTVNDGQMLWLKELLHEMEKSIYYTAKEN